MTAVEWAPQTSPAPANGVVRWASLVAPAMELANIVSETDFVPDDLRGQPGAIAACILYGDELGIGPLEALQSVQVIKGRPSPSAALRRALILQAGHSFLIHEATGTRCTVSGLRKGRPESERYRVTWTLEQARAAGLLSSSPSWNRYPRAMLMARASSELATQVFPDVMRGLGDSPDSDATAAEVDGWTVSPDAPPGPAPTKVARKQITRRPANPLEDTGDVELPPELLAPFEPVEKPQEAPPAAPEAPPVTPAPTPRPSASDTWPPLPPEPPRGADKPIGPGLRRALMAAFTSIGVDPSAQRELRLALTSSVVGRRIESSRQLTHPEGVRVAAALADVETGAAKIGADADGAPIIVTLREPPGDDG